MMNWNQNDTKYILKRIILYFIIAGIVFFAGHSCAKATVLSDYIYDPTLNGGRGPQFTINSGQLTRSIRVTNSAGTQRDAFVNAGEGTLIFTGVANIDSGITSPITSIFIHTSEREFTCELGNIQNYVNNTEQYNVFTVKCPVEFNNGQGLRYIITERGGDVGKLYIDYSSIVTFVSKDTITNYSSDINSAIQNIAVGNATAHQDATAIQNAINNEITSINNQTTAINNQTQAINNQTDWFDQDYNSIIDTEFLDVFDDLFDNDDDVVRQFILIPLNFFVLIYNACSSNTCSPIELGELYGTTLTIPCINWSSLLGTAVTNTIDIIFAGCLVFGMIRMIKKMINKIMTLSSTITDECGVEVFK